MSVILTLFSSFVLILLSIILSPITKIIPRNKNLWIFVFLGGKEFLDNPKHLFLYTQNNHKEIRAIWLSKNKNILLALRESGYECYYTYSPQGFYFTLIAGYIFYSNLILSDVNLIGSIGAIRINLWHGIPLKKSERMPTWDFLELLIKPI